jgi:hypothetical protein
MALWKDIVSQWDDESRNVALGEIIRDKAEKPITQEELEAFFDSAVKNSNGRDNLAQQIYTTAYEVYLSERSKIVCKVGKLI